MPKSIPTHAVNTIIFACEAGLTTSVMGVIALKKKLKQADLNINVIRSPVQTIPGNARVILIHKTLAALAHQQAPNALVISFAHFIDDPVFDKIIQMLKNGELGEV